jgi:RNA polymerase sigma-70 factor (ECF subfamily)
MMTEEDAVACIAQCLAGKKEAFARIVRGFQKQVYHLCFHFTGTRQDAEDAVTDIFVKVFRSLGSFNDSYRFSTWLYRIAYHHLVEISRKRKRERQYLESAGLNRAEPVEEAAPEAVFFREAAKEEMQRALQSLPPHYRTALMLKYHQGLSYRQIGDIMDVPVNTVGSLILRGKRELRQRIKQREDSNEVSG